MQHVVMEATGVYRKPVWQILESHFELRAAVRVRAGYLQARFYRIRFRARRGTKKAIIAVAASMLTAAWHMLKDGTEWYDLGAAHFDRTDATKTANRLIQRLQQIGYQVTVVAG